MIKPKVIFMKQVTLQLPEELEQQLTQLAQTQGRSETDLIQVAVEIFLAQHQLPFGTPSCLDLVQDLAGSLDGPPDLATNPRYMEGFGH